MSRPTSVFPSTGTSSSLRQSSAHPNSSQQASSLAARIASKRLELENLRQLRDVSGALASQMQALEEKLATLKDGTEAKVAEAGERDSEAPAKDLDGHGQKTPLPSTLVRIPAEQSSSSRRPEEDPSGA
ncbi:hypothetical protein FQN53_008698 [Emmonsiellopsis sp. PD_33]|nr:hypothetical protein FQN53_008698 [Emmonsiellopsis sp. PD_33]KAK2796331.1 hypothetical protein FQN51_009421 [Onygenales sp. PD_10]